MERKKDKKNIIIVFLLVIVFIMSVGFALLGSELEVTATGTVAGDWDVHFVDETFTPVAKTSGANVVSTVLDKDGLKLTLNTTFEKPGDSVTFEFEIENTGSIDAYLKSVSVTGVEGNTEAIKLSYDVKNAASATYASGSIAGITHETITTPSPTVALLNKKVDATVEKNYLTVTLEYLDTTTTVAEDASSTYTLKLYYEQTDAN